MAKSAFITGGCYGTGYAVAERFAKEGYNIFISGRGKSKVDKAALEISEKYGYTVNMKEYKKNPDGFKGNISHVSTVIRVAVCGRVNTPDMYDVLKIMGKALVKERLEKWI